MPEHSDQRVMTLKDGLLVLGSSRYVRPCLNANFWPCCWPSSLCLWPSGLWSWNKKRMFTWT